VWSECLPRRRRCCGPGCRSRAAGSLNPTVAAWPSWSYEASLAMTTCVQAGQIACVRVKTLVIAATEAPEGMSGRESRIRDAVAERRRRARTDAANRSGRRRRDCAQPSGPRARECGEIECSAQPWPFGRTLGSEMHLYLTATWINGGCHMQSCRLFADAFSPDAFEACRRCH